MKRTTLVLGLLILNHTSIGAEGIRYDIVVSKSGEVVTQPSVWSEFNQVITLEIPSVLRVKLKTKPPVNGWANVNADIYSFNGTEMVTDWNAKMPAYISKTPSFEHNMKNGYRVVIMPRASDGPGDNTN